MRNIVIIGAGGFGREVQWLIERINEKEYKEKGEKKWNILGYIDDVMEVGIEIDGYKVLGGVAYLISLDSPVAVTCAVGAPETRKKIIEKIKSNINFYFPNLIDPTVQISNRIKIGKGNIICAGNILTVHIKIADFCIINLGCTIGHDDVLYPFVTICPNVNVSGSVKIGECSEIGTGTQIIQGKNIGTGAVIGAGAVVIKDIPDRCTAVGSPCKPIKFH